MKVNGVYVKDYMKLDVMRHEIPNEPGPNEVLLKQWHVVFAVGIPGYTEV